MRPECGHSLGLLCKSEARLWLFGYEFLFFQMQKARKRSQAFRIRDIEASSPAQLAARVKFIMQKNARPLGE